MKIGVVGLGLIGGSFAKAYKKAGHMVYAEDIDESVMKFAMLSDAIDGRLTDEEMPDWDLILMCTYPKEAIRYMEEKGGIFGKKPIVMDTCGTKRTVVDNGMKLAEKYGFTFVGGHPMAGTQFSGFKNSKAEMFKGAPMVIVPASCDDIVFLDKIKGMLLPAGFTMISTTTAAEHDARIAFTSQLAHVVSNAYVKSPTAKTHKGFSAGSYKDLTRVARLNPGMWAELFLENKENLSNEIGTIIDNLQKYKDAIDNNDEEGLKEILLEGSNIKKEIDG